MRRGLGYIQQDYECFDDEVSHPAVGGINPSQSSAPAVALASKEINKIPPVF
jgi:hypothetical protein